LSKVSFLLQLTVVSSMDMNNNEYLNL